MTDYLKEAKNSLAAGQEMSGKASDERIEDAKAAAMIAIAERLGEQNALLDKLIGAIGDNAACSYEALNDLRVEVGKQ